LERLYKNHIELRCKDKTGTLLDGTMEDHVREWLQDKDKNVMLILGEWGDGKTAFTYLLSRNLALDFLNDPDNGWIPLRLSLSYYRFAQGPQSFLEERLKEFNADLGSWNNLREKKILVILDGFDEMSRKLDSESIKKNIGKLTECCKEFKGMKIIITSRTHFFENKQDERLLLQRMGDPPIFYLAPFERQKTIAYLEKSNTSPKRKEILSIVSKLHDPLGLTLKPLYLQMFEATLNKFQEEEPDESKLKEINEISIYDAYIDETLDRKIDLLEREEKIADLMDLSSNLKKILEQIAIKLQESNDTYISLEKFSEEFGKKYDEILWKISDSGKQVNETDTEKYDSSEDAAARVQVRSLLTRVTGDNIKGRRPINFFHRSMHEYFVAKGICRALSEDKERASRLLAKLPLTHEILYFTAELMKKNYPGNFEKNLLEIIRSTFSFSGGDSPGGNAITLLFRLLGKLPGSDWSGLNLDGANLSGANLSGKNFRETSMRFANLDNVNFEEADFSNSDLTGVRIEETAPVLATVARHFGNRIFAAYKDNTIRKWKNINKPGGAVSKIVVENTKGNVIFLGFLHGPNLYAMTNEELIFYDFDDKEKLIQRARFRLKPNYRKVVVKNDLLFHL
jgi:hypothetical protein